MTDTDDEPREYASPACMMHEVDPAYMNLPPRPASEARADIMAWRKAERARLIDIRRTMPAATRRTHGQTIALHLETLLGDVAGLTVGGYWPIRGEPDLRDFMDAVACRGGRTALPIVVKHGEPLIFRAWSAGDPLERGVWNIPVPRADAPLVVPDVLIAPLVGYDGSGYRLGYGGGFFDRTLASLPDNRRAIGVGYSTGALATIYPQWHDIPMNQLVTEKGITDHPAP